MEYGGELAPHVGQLRGGSPLKRYDWARGKFGMRGANTYADWLGDHGFASVRIVREQVAAWRAVYEEERPDLVVGDQAPLALLAARSLGIATAAVGVPYTLPPSSLPHYLPMHPGAGESLWPEDQLVQSVNAAMSTFGGPLLSRLPQVYETDAELCCSPDILDLYASVRKAPRLPSLIPPFQHVSGPRDEVFVYYSLNDRVDPVMLTAVQSLPVPTRMFMPNVDPALIGIFRAKRVMAEDTPVSPTDIGRRSRVVVHAGNHGITSLCLRAGLPFLAAPRQQEQDFNARQCAAEGICIRFPPNERAVPAVQAAVLELYESAEAQNRARALAEHLAPQFAQDPRDIIAERIGALFH
jgi:hypothetical protein